MQRTMQQPMQSACCSPSSEASLASASPESSDVSKSPAFTPSVDIVCGQDEVLIFADLPGAKPQGIEVSFDRGVLRLDARVERRSSSGRPLRQEYAVGDYRRSFTLSEEYDGSKTRAEFHDGVLCLTIPKAAVAPVKRVEIRAGHG